MQVTPKIFGLVVLCLSQDNPLNSWRILGKSSARASLGMHLGINVNNVTAGTCRCVFNIKIMMFILSLDLVGISKWRCQDL